MFASLDFLIPYILFFIPSLVLHEFAHAFVAYKLGDDTPKLVGRLTLNPLAHLDLMGTLAIFLIGFGWAKPVPINPYNFKKPKRDTSLVSLAGPTANFIIVILGSLLIKIFGYNIFILNLILTNVVLGTFNLIPLGPLDGFKVFAGILPDKLSRQWEESYNFTYILLFMMLLLPIQGQTLVNRIIYFVNNLVVTLIL